MFFSKRKKENALKNKIFEELKIELSINMDLFCNKLFYLNKKDDIPLIQEFFQEEIYNVIQQKIDKINE